MTDVFLYDRQLDVIQRVSMAWDDSQGDGHSYDAVISADGLSIAFVATATNLVPGDANSEYDIFVYDRQSNTVERVSIAHDGSELNGNSHAPSLSGDGQFVAYQSYADNVVPLDWNAAADVFVYDRQAGRVERVNVSTDGLEANDYTGAGVISADGRYVVYDSRATNLVPGDTNNWTDVFVMDRQTYTVRRLSVANDGTQGTHTASDVAISPEGGQVAFGTWAPQLVSGDTNDSADLFLAGTNLRGTHSVTLAAGQTVVDQHFASRQLRGEISGTKWHDLDLDGVQDAGEPGLPGWVVFLDANQNLQLDAGELSTTTDAEGNYQLTDLPEGLYSVVEVLTGGWGQTYPANLLRLPEFQASLRDQPPDGTADSVDAAEWLLLQTSSAETRVVAEFDTAILAGTQLDAAQLDFSMFINNGGGAQTRQFAIYVYPGNGAVDLDDFTEPGYFAGTVTLTVATGMADYQVDVTSALQSVLDDGASVAGIRFDPLGTDIFATGVRDLRLTVAAPTVGAPYDMWLVPGQVVPARDFGNFNAAPTDLRLEPAAINENTDTSSSDVPVGSLVPEDRLPGDSYTFSLVAGTGDDDNASFIVVGEQLHVRQGIVLDYETKPSYSVRVRADDGLHTLEKVLTVSVTNLPEVQNVTIGNGSASRSVVQQLVVTFDQLMTLDPGAFLVNQRGASGGPVDVSFAHDISTGVSIATLTFSGSFTNPASGSLNDGNYDLTIDATKARGVGDTPLDGQRNGTATDYLLGTEAVDKFFRFYGDRDGDRDVDLTDFAFFRRTYGKSLGETSFDSQFDYDGDGDVDLSDFAFFRRNYGKTLAF